MHLSPTKLIALGQNIFLGDCFLSIIYYVDNFYNYDLSQKYDGPFFKIEIFL